MQVKSASSVNSQEWGTLPQSKNSSSNPTLFDDYSGNNENLSNINIYDLNITEDKIAGLLSTFADEIVSIMGANLSFISKTNIDNFNDINQNNKDAQGSNKNLIA